MTYCARISKSMEINCDIIQRDTTDQPSGRSDFTPPLELSSTLASEQQELHCLDTDADYGPDGYGPQFIAEETEIVAAEPQIDLEKEVDSYEGGLQNGGENCVTVNDSGETLNHGIRSEDLSELGEVTPSSLADTIYTIKKDQVIFQPASSSGLPHSTITLANGTALTPAYISGDVGSVQLLLTDGQLQLINERQTPPSVRAINSGPLPAHSIKDHQKFLADKERANREQKRVRDREKKRMLRADPEYKQKEREKSLQRMRLRRLDPVYRSVERVRDRIRRKISRQENPEVREAERERDRISKRLQRLRTLNMQMMDMKPNSTYLEKTEISRTEKIIVESVHGCVISGTDVDTTVEAMLSSQVKNEILVGNCDVIANSEHLSSGNGCTISVDTVNVPDC